MIPQQTTQNRTYTVNGKPFGVSNNNGLRQRLEQARVRTELTDRFNKYMAAVHQHDAIISGDMFGREDYGLMSRLQQSNNYRPQSMPETSKKNIADYVIGAAVAAIEYFASPMDNMAYGRA